MIRRGLGLSTAATALLAAMGCSNDAPGGSAADATQSASNAQQTESGQPPGESSGSAADENTLAEFQVDIVRAEAETLLGMNESDLELSRMLRIVRRGEDRLPATMDLRPGRMNVELDDHAGTYVVTRVVVETPDGSVVVE